MFHFPIPKISALVLVFPPETLHLTDLAALLRPCRNMLGPSSCWLANGTVCFQKSSVHTTWPPAFSEICWTNWQRQCYSRTHPAGIAIATSSCLLYKGVSFLNHLNMVRGYATSNRTLQDNVHTRANTLRLTWGPYQRWQLLFSSGSKSSQQMALFSSYSVMLWF